MPEFPPSGVAQDAAERAPQTLTPDTVSAVLADFRDWLMALTEEPANGGRQPPVRNQPEADAPRSPDLHTLLGQFLAVRQEVNLQTRAVRAQQEQNTETLRQLSAALDALRQSQARAEQTQQQERDEAIRPLLKTLVDLYDALALAGREIERIRATMHSSLEQLAPSAAVEASPSPAPAAPPFWARLLGLSPPQPDAASSERSLAQQERLRLARESSERVWQFVGSLVTGYFMSVQRIERALRQHGLEVIPTIGERFDPERMEVVEAVADSGCPSGAVLDEVRRGYLWNDRVFRYAQVRVAKS